MRMVAPWRRRWFGTRAAIALLIALLPCAPMTGIPQAMAQGPAQQAPPPAVVVAEVTAEPVAPPAEFVGRVEAIRAVDVRARVQGYITEVAFEEGRTVNAGQALFVLDPAQYEAEMASAEARLAGARANAQEAERNLARTIELRRTNTAPQARVDEAEAAFHAARAEVQSAEAALRLAQLNMSYTRIEASISGRIGRALYTVGALVGPDSGALARIVQTDPLRVVFSITEGMIVDFRQAQLRGGGMSPEGIVFRLRLPNGALYDAEGHIDFVASEVDPNTGTVAARVQFANPDGILLPGQFVTMIIAEREPERQPVAPFSAVQRDRQGAYVFVLAEDGRVAQRRIETGARLRQGWAVRAGLTEGETVVVQGTQRLRDGARVTPVPRDDSDGSAVPAAERQQ